MALTGTRLRRKLGLFSVTNIVIANMIGAGIFTTSGLLIADLKNPILMILLWIVGGIIALCGALSYGELGAAIPRAGGEYTFLSRLYHPMLGFLSGWVSFIVGFSAPIAASALGFSAYFFRAFPQLAALGVSSDILQKLLAVLIIGIFILIHLRGLELGTKIQNPLTVLKVGLIVGLVVLGFFSGKGSMHHLLPESTFTLNLSGWKTIGLSLMWIMFAYSGWNASTYIGSEIKSPRRNLPLSLLIGTGVVILLYASLNLFFVYAIPPEDMKGVISIGGLAAGKVFGLSAERLFSLLISFALFSSISAFIIIGPRVYYAMAKRNHFFKFAADVHPVFNVPSKAILLQGAIAIVMVMSGTFDQILTYMGFSLGLFPILTVIGVFKLRRTHSSPQKFPGFPVVQIFYIVSGVLILGLGFLERPVESSIALATVATGIPLYFYFLRVKKDASFSSDVKINKS